MRLWVLAVILILLAAASALFSAIETAFFSLQPLQLRRLRETHARLADCLSRLLENPRRVLSALLLADALANVPLIVLSLYTLREVGAAARPLRRRRGHPLWPHRDRLRPGTEAARASASPIGSLKSAPA